MTRVPALAALLAVAVFAQNPPAIHLPKMVRRVVEVKNLSGDRAARATRLVKAFMSGDGGLDYDANLQTAVLWGNEEVVAGAEALLRKFDTPASATASRGDRQVLFRFYLVEGSPEGPGGPIPPDITGAVEQMKKAFVYKGYRLLDTILLNSRNSGRAGISGMLPAQSERADVRAHYNLNYASADIVDEGKAVFVRELRLNLNLPLVTASGNVQRAETSISSDITVQTGQKLVLGKLSAEQGRSAIFVIVTADIQ